MARLVLLSEGFTGRSQELVAEKTTVGRVDDNTFHIADPSVSSHHCEILLRGSDVVVKDLNSTNGSFIDGNQVTETVLKPGQILRLGQIQMRLESGDAPAAGGAGASAASKKTFDQTMVMEKRGGVKLNELEAGPRATGLEASGKGFSKKTGGGSKWFIIAAVILGVIIVGLLVWVALIVKSGK
jgi:hypothetical protein